MEHLQINMIRHAESTGNAAKLIQGQSDAPLTNIGENQADALARYWKDKDITFDLIISSPQARARSTAQRISKALQVPLNFDDNWMERAFGNLEGISFSEILKQVPMNDFFHPYTRIGGNGESVMDLFLRASKAVQDLLANPPGQYLVVSHGALLNMALYAILGLNPQNYHTGPRFHFKNTGVTELTYDPGARVWRFLGFNQLPHWNTVEEGSP
jgi:broad specificity phosphatase PhoE